MTDEPQVTNSYESLAHRLLQETSEKWRISYQDVAALIWRVAFPSTHQCHKSRCISTGGWTEHNDPCDDPPYPGGCRLEIVRPGKVQCECDNDLTTTKGTA